MIQKPAIVTFANQKGGTGKTTLCVTFANYLVTKGVRTVVVDCDFQRSIAKCRNADIRKYGEERIPYDVAACGIDDREAVTTVMERLHNDPSIDVALVDTPGSLKAAGLVPLFVNSDIIAVPFHYDLVTVSSTAAFLLFMERLRKAAGGRMKASLFIIPNLHDGRVGKRAELALWNSARETFSNHGFVTEKIPKRADMQGSIVAPAFESIYAEIFGTSEPIRETPLHGIQLTENAYPKHGKKGAGADKETTE